ncbi:hypothetical protein CUC08_Gglean005608 [Alternaria sp. MG1]|jgi:hypothetical protein|nr:hypothetical protein CUC08_Gglean005608 [Alternaria sp. MG1]
MLSYRLLHGRRGTARGQLGDAQLVPCVSAARDESGIPACIPLIFRLTKFVSPKPSRNMHSIAGNCGGYPFVSPYAVQAAMSLVPRFVYRHLHVNPDADASGGKISSSLRDEL